MMGGIASLLMWVKTTTSDEVGNLNRHGGQGGEMKSAGDGKGTMCRIGRGILKPILNPKP